MKRKVGTFCMIIGAALVVMALSLFLYNQWDANRAERASAEVLEKMVDQIGDGEDSENSDWNREMTVKNIDGYDYIGYLSIPSISLDLPIMAQWSYPGLKISPGRYAGTTFRDNLVIAGHNYRRHFTPIKWLEQGTAVNFTDMDGRVWKYQVSSIETLQPTQVEDMVGKTEGDDWDLTLFTCNTGGQTRCAVRCVRIQ